MPLENNISILKSDVYIKWHGGDRCIIRYISVMKKNFNVRDIILGVYHGVKNIHLFLFCQFTFDDACSLYRSFETWPEIDKL